MSPFPSPFSLSVIEFDTPVGLASPIGRTNAGFIGGGVTKGGAREFVVPNFSIDELINVTMRIVPDPGFP